jgi:hypothetical protein
MLADLGLAAVEPELWSQGMKELLDSNAVHEPPGDVSA